MDAATQNLLDGLKAYTDGLIPAIQSTQQTGKLNQVSALIASTISKQVPGAAQAQSIANTVLGLVGSATGPYSTLSRIAKDALTGGPVIGMINVIKDLNGRTFQSDQYKAAMYWRYLVLGDSKCTSTNMVADGDVANALQFFINKTGVFISGSEHLEALQSSVQDYLNLSKVNAYTTTDTTRVSNAVAVMKRYMPDANIYVQPAGIWANAVGVFDNLLAGLVVNSPAYNTALQQAKQTYAATDQVPVGVMGIGVSNNELLLIGAVIIVVVVIYMSI